MKKNFKKIAVSSFCFCLLSITTVLANPAVSEALIMENEYKNIESGTIVDLYDYDIEETTKFSPEMEVIEEGVNISLDDSAETLLDQSKEKTSSVPTAVHDISKSNYTANVINARWTYTNSYFTNHGGDFYLTLDNAPGSINVDVYEVGSNKNVLSYTHESGTRMRYRNLDPNKAYYFKFSIPNIFDTFSAKILITDTL